MQAIEPALDVVGADEMSLVRAARNGDVGAFEELIRRNDRSVFRIARNIVQNHEEAEEVVQDVFLKAFEHLDQFQQKSRFSTWLYRIAVNTALMRLRKWRGGHVVSIDQYDQSEPGAMPHEIVDWRPNPERLYGRSELREILARNLDALPAHYRTVFLLRDVEGLSTEETAATLGLSITAVKARLMRARLQLRQRLTSYFEPPKNQKRHTNDLRLDQDRPGSGN